MTLIFPLPGNETMASQLSTQLGAALGILETRRFPDGETYIRLTSDVSGHDVVFVCTLARPDDQFLRLVFAARAAKESGAKSLTLVAPYLAYMRQDTRFHPGEAVTSDHFATLLSKEFDRLITIDPHLHRHHDLSEIYTIPAIALHATPLLIKWIAKNVTRPYIIGPDIESAQWIRGVAESIRAPFVVLQKERRGDRNVKIAVPDLEGGQEHTMVLIDDIVASGRTMIEVAEGLLKKGFAKPVCVVVHPLFAEDAFVKLSQLAAMIASTDTVPHTSNKIAIASLLAQAIRDSHITAS